jgi:DNA-binding beta-propeller fold protein YncE
MWIRIAISLSLVLMLLPVAAFEVKLEFLAESRVDLENPHDLKLSTDGKNLLVSDVGNNRVVLLDPESLERVGEFGADHQSGTHDIDFDTAGRAYVADTHNNRVTIYEMNGTSASLVGELSKGIRGPEGVLIHPNGMVYVAGAWSNNVIAYRDGNIIIELKAVSSPHDLELAANGDIWLADAGNSRLLLLTPELKVKEKLNRKTYDFNGVRYLDLTAGGMIVAADKNNHVVKFIAPDRTLVHVLGDGRPGRGDYQLTTPEGVEIRGSTLWISDSGNDRVIKYQFEAK